MKKTLLILSILIFILCVYESPAQKVQNVSAEVEEGQRGYINIYYTLKAKGDFKYNKFIVEAYLLRKNRTPSNSLLNNNLIDTVKLKALSGSVGRNVTPSINETKLIQWDYLNEGIEFDGKDVAFKVSAKLNKSYYENRLKDLGGPQNAMNSILIPGWGDYKVRSGKNYWWITALTYSALGSGLILRYQSEQNYQKYQNEINLNDAELLYDKAQNQKRASNYLIGIGGTIWISDILLVFSKGIQNKNRYRKLRELSYYE